MELFAFIPKISLNHLSQKIQMILLRIAYYATTHTQESVFIIGGWTDGRPKKTSLIARYNDDNWTNVGSLNQAREAHGAIAIEEIVIILGGYPISDSL